ncbi:MAG: OmcA/MtrC family decaheme c-type cytochrome [Acidobacteria bacterium]|nr:OmcA/MtrC family decaheme c-type cytochrome [Acidobacteriota bacterium]
MKAVIRKYRMALLAILAIGLILPIAAQRADNRAYSPIEKEYYVDGKDLAFIRPGLKVAIQRAEIAGETARVTFRIVDDRDVALDRSGIQTPGVVSLNFVLARIKQGERQYTAYTTRMQPNPTTGRLFLQGTADSGGSYAGSADGVYTYTFGTRIPSAEFDPNVTHTVGIYATRDVQEFGLGVYVANAVFDWVPAGRPVSVVRDVVRTETCNAACHDPLAAHGGGSRREVRLCVLCHTPQTTDHVTGNTTDMKVMIHKIHRGANLPSVEAGGRYEIEDGDFTDVKFPRDIRNCEVCHTGGSQSNNYQTQPARAPCGACHDDVNFVTGGNHGLGGAQTSDTQCTVCHSPDTGREFDISVKGAHTIPERSSQLAGVNFEILSVEGTSAGSKPTVTFKITDNKGNLIEPSKMSRFRLGLGGPTNDSTFHVREDAKAATTGRSGYTYQFTTAIPANSKGTFVVAPEGFLDVTLTKVDGSKVTARDSGTNKMFYFGVTDASPVRRRVVVSQAKCNACHEKLQVHSQSRDNLEYCSVCHRPGFTDESERPADKRPAEAMDFKNLIHKIHSGHNLENEFTIYDAGDAENFNKIRFSGDRRNCSKCHEGTSYQLPLPKGLLSTITPRGFFSPTPPTAAACLACHDSLSAAAHAFVNIAPFGEACATCHGQDAEFAVTKVHAR